MPAPFVVASNTTGLPVWTVDNNGNVQAAGTAQSTGLILPAASAPAAVTGVLALYSPDGTTLSGITGLSGVSTVTPPSGGSFAVGGVQTPASEFLPTDLGFNAWTYDPGLCINQTAAVNGTLYLVQVVLRYATRVTNLSFALGAGAVTPTANQNFLGMYDSTGARVAQTAAGAIDSATTGTGPITQALPAPVNLAAGKYWVAVLLNAATPAQLARAGSFQSTPNAGSTTATMRFAVNGTGLTSLPASITPASNTSNNNITIWAATS